MTDFLSNFITPKNVDSWIRAGLVGVGTWLADHGASATDVQTIIGAAGILGSLAWSYFTHKPKAA